MAALGSSSSTLKQNYFYYFCRYYCDGQGAILSVVLSIHFSLVCHPAPCLVLRRPSEIYRSMTSANDHPTALPPSPPRTWKIVRHHDLKNHCCGIKESQPGIFMIRVGSGFSVSAEFQIIFSLKKGFLLLSYFTLR